MSGVTQAARIDERSKQVVAARSQDVQRIHRLLHSSRSSVVIAIAAFRLRYTGQWSA